MKTINFFLTLLIIIVVNSFIGCSTEAVKVDSKPIDRYRLYKNEITGEFYLTQERDWGTFACISGDSLECMNYIKDAAAEKRREQEEAKRDAEIKAAWHEVNLPEVK